MARVDGTETSGTEGGSVGGASGIASIDPREIDSAASDTDSGGADISPRTGKPKRAYNRRGDENKVGSVLPERKPEAKKGSPLSVNAIQFSLTGIHALLAAGLSAPELELSEVEAKTVSENIVAVSKHFDVQQSAKATDIGNLVISLGIVYGGKAIAITQRTKRENLAKRAAGAPMGVVVNNQRPATVRVEHPVAAGKPAGAMPMTRPKTEADQALLNEIEPFMA